MAYHIMTVTPIELDSGLINVLGSRTLLTADTSVPSGGLRKSFPMIQFINYHGFHDIIMLPYMNICPTVCLSTTMISMTSQCCHT